MTIVTQAFNEKKQQKEPLVGQEEVMGASAPIDVEHQAETDGRRRAAAILVHLQRNRSRQIQALTTTCIFLMALAVFTAGIFTSFYLYKAYTQSKVFDMYSIVNLYSFSLFS